MSSIRAVAVRIATGISGRNHWRIPHRPSNQPGLCAVYGFSEGEMIVDETPEEYAWMLQARCRGASPTEFFPSDGLGVESAQHICHGCPVQVECLEYALENRIEHGVWGGASERERRRILRRRRQLSATQN